MNRTESSLVKEHGVVLLISAASFLLGLIETRLMSVIYFQHVVYFIVTMSLLGNAVSGVIFSLSKTVKNVELRTLIAICLGGFLISTIVGIWRVTNLSTETFNFENALELTNLVKLLVSYLLLMIPFVFVGLLILGVLNHQPRNVGRTYFLNLFGSALGSLAYNFAIQPFGAVNLLLFGVMAPLALLIPFFIRGRLVLKGFWVLYIGFLVLMSYWWLKIEPGKNKQFWVRLKSDQKHIFSEWNPISRVDVVSDLENKDVFILIDGDATAPIPPSKKRIDDSYPTTPLSELNAIHDGFKNNRGSIAYRMLGKTPEETLVIGVGGGLDVVAADYFSSKRITGVEVNPSTFKLIHSNICKNRWGDILDPQRTQIHLDDGRSYIRKSSTLYDVIMLHGVDSFTALSTGAYVQVEAYLYTMEAFAEYYDRLTDDGIIQISRWMYEGTPREELRAFTMAYEMLQKKGVREPSEHLMVIMDPPSKPFATLLISKKPLDPTRIPPFKNWAINNQFRIGFDPTARTTSNNYYYKFVAAAESGGLETFYREYPFEVRPVYDDNPFFFQYGKWTHLFYPYDKGHEYWESLLGRWPFFVILSVLFQSLIIGAILLFFQIRSVNESRTAIIRTTSYFGCLGFAFMAIEVFLIQKLVFVLGHPVYSMSVTIPALLISAGLGSLSVSKLSNRVGLKCVLALPFLLFLWIILLSNFSNSIITYPFHVRALFTVLAIFPIGFFMGVPFPMGLVQLTKNPELVPISWTSNGVTSVLASILTILFALFFGFTVTAVAAIGVYAVASWQLLNLKEAVKDRTSESDLFQPSVFSPSAQY